MARKEYVHTGAIAKDLLGTKKGTKLKADNTYALDWKTRTVKIKDGIFTLVSDIKPYSSNSSSVYIHFVNDKNEMFVSIPYEEHHSGFTIVTD